MEEIDKILESIKELRNSQKETSLQIKELKEISKKNSEEVKKTSDELRKLGFLTRKFLKNYGDSTEELFFRSLEEKMQLGNVKFDTIKRNLQNDPNSYEFDIVLVNGKYIGLIEIKSGLNSKYIKDMKEKKISTFREEFPEYANHTLLFGFASLITTDDMIEEATKNNIFLLTQKGNSIEIVNQEMFI